MEIEFVSQKDLSIDNLVLDWDNPRLRSRYKEEYKTKGIDKEKILMCNLIAFYNVDELVKDILVNTLASLHVFNSDHIIVQKSFSNNDFYDVKEGNRRICALKILQNHFVADGSLLSEINEFMENQGLYALDSELHSKFNENRVKISNFINKNKSIGQYIKEVPCNVYDSTDEASQLLKNVLRRMHIQKKRAWSSLDKKLFDYDDIIMKIQNGYPSVEDAIKALLKEEEEITNEKVTIGLLKNQQSEFLTTAFYHYVKQEIEKGLLGEEKIVLKDRLLLCFLPVCEVMRKGMESSCGVKFEYIINDKCLEYCLSQELGYPKLNNLKEFVNECVLKILNIEGTRTISHQNFRNTKLDLAKENKKETKFWLFFSDVISKYLDENGIVNENDEPTSKTITAGIYLKNQSNGSVIRVKLPSVFINLREKIDKVIDTNEELVDLDNVEIYCNDIRVFPTNGVELIDAQIASTSIIVQYKYIDSNSKTLLSQVTYDFYAEEVPSDENQRKIFEFISLSNLIEIPSLRTQLISEINKLSTENNKNLLALSLRCLFEIPVRALFDFQEFDILFRTSGGGLKNMRTCVENLEKYIYANFDTIPKCNEIAQLYNIDPHVIRNNMTDTSCDYLNTYLRTHAAMHGNFAMFTELKILDYGNEARNWVYIVNYIYRKANSTNI